MGGASTRQAPRAGAVFTPRARCAHTVGRRASSSSATRLTFGGCGCRTDPPLGRSRSERCWESMVGGSKSSGPSQTPTRPPSLSASPLSKRGPSTCADIAEMPPRCRRDAAEMPPVPCPTALCVERALPIMYFATGATRSSGPSLRGETGNGSTRAATSGTRRRASEKQPCLHVSRAREQGSRP